MPKLEQLNCTMQTIVKAADREEREVLNKKVTL